MKRSIARGHDGRNYQNKTITSNGADAIENRKRSKKGNYVPEFVEMYSKVSSKDVELRYEYGKDLLSKHLGVRRDLVKLEEKRDGTINTVTSRDEVFFVYVGLQVAGKLSIRTQRTWRSTDLLFIFQVKKVINQTSSKAFGRTNKKKKSKGATNHGKRATYNKARGK